MPGTDSPPANPKGAGSLASAGEDLLERIKAGDQAAFALLVERNFDAVYRLAYRMLGGPSEAEDVAQEAFLKLWTAPSGIRDGAAIKSWLMRVGANLAVDRMRRKRPEAVAELPDVADASDGAETRLRRGEAAQEVDAAIASLPDRQRMALVLTYYEGLGNQEVARVLEISVEAVESLLSRARRSLKGALSGRWRDLLAEFET